MCTLNKQKYIALFDIVSKFSENVTQNCSSQKGCLLTLIDELEKIYGSSLDDSVKTRLALQADAILRATVSVISLKPSPSDWMIEKTMNTCIDITSAMKDATTQSAIADEFMKSSVSSVFMKTNTILKYQSTLLGYHITAADLALFITVQAIIETKSKQSIPIDISEYCHLKRWYYFIKDLIMNETIPIKPCSTVANKLQNREKSKTPSSIYIGKLPGAIKGKVVTRLPPEPSGYLHIGHAKAALLNSYFANLYDGKFIVRFDDTNPTKEKMEFEEVILEDLRLLKISLDNITHTSDYFDQIQEYCEQLIKKGLCYADNTPVDIMRQQRADGIESHCRNYSVDDNYSIWNRMKQGDLSATTYCIRAKIDMKSKNKCMRDFVMFRCIVNTPHHIHGYKYKVYPTYDFACPIVDSLEGVTHAMRTNEYADRIPQYEWVLRACGFQPIIIYEFSRLNFVNTVLSKRKLQWFVDNNFVESWADPRFPTVRGLLRRGLQVEALLEFILQQGPSKNTNYMEWDKLWTINKQLLDPIVPRYMTVSAETEVQVKIINGPTTVVIKNRSLHPKNPDVGVGNQVFFNLIKIEKEDADSLNVGEEITLMRWGNVCVKDITKTEDSYLVLLELTDGDYKNTKKKIHWVATPQEGNYTSRLIILREYDHLILKKKPDENDSIENIWNANSKLDTLALTDSLAVDALTEGSIIQFERRGYYRLDNKDSKELMPIFIKIPDGKSKAMSIVTTKVDAKLLNQGKS